MRACLKSPGSLSPICNATAILLAAFLISRPVAAQADDVDSDSGPADAVVATGIASDALTGPDAVNNQLADDRTEKTDFLETNLLEEWEDFKKGVNEETGLHFGADYNMLFYGATASLGDDVTVTSVARFLGSWELIGRGTKDTGSLVFKVEHREALTDFSAVDFGGQLGYAGLISLGFSDVSFRTTTLYWRQSFLDGHIISYAGFVDITDFVDVYALGSPWTSFGNLAFATGSGTIGGLPDGAFGAMLGGFVTDNIYAVASIADANANASKLFRGFDTFFSDFETFKSFEIGWTSSSDRLFVDNVHVTLWQIDERQATGAAGGWGVSFSATTAVGDKWLPFLRGGWANDGSSIYEASVSVGFGYQPEPGGDLLGVGVNWGRPNSDTFGADLDDQFTAEMFYRLQLTENVQLTPSVQFLGNPAFNRDDNFIALFGLRGRISF